MQFPLNFYFTYIILPLRLRNIQLDRVSFCVWRSYLSVLLMEGKWLSYILGNDSGLKYLKYVILGLNRGTESCSK